MMIKTSWKFTGIWSLEGDNIGRTRNCRWKQRFDKGTSQSRDEEKSSCRNIVSRDIPFWNNVRDDDPISFRVTFKQGSSRSAVVRGESRLHRLSRHVFRGHILSYCSQGESSSRAHLVKKRAKYFGSVWGRKMCRHSYGAFYRSQSDCATLLARWLK